MKRKKFYHQWLSFYCINLKSKSKPRVSRKKESMKNRNQQIFSKDRKNRENGQSQKRWFFRKTNQVDIVDWTRKKKREEEQKLSKSAMKKRLLIQILQTLKDNVQLYATKYENRWNRKFLWKIYSTKIDTKMKQKIWSFHW